MPQLSCRAIRLQMSFRSRCVPALFVAVFTAACGGAVFTACGGAVVPTTNTRTPRTEALAPEVQEMLGARGPNAFVVVAVQSNRWQELLSGARGLVRSDSTRELLTDGPIGTSRTFVEALFRFLAPSLSAQHLASIENDVSVETKALFILDAPPIELAALLRELLETRARHPFRGRVLIPSPNPERLILAVATALEASACVEQTRSSTTVRAADERAFQCRDLFVVLERGAHHLRVELSGEAILDPSNSATQNVSPVSPLLERAVARDEPFVAHAVLSRLTTFGAAHGAFLTRSALPSIPETDGVRRTMLAAALSEILAPLGFVRERALEVGEAALVLQLPRNGSAAINVAFHLTAHGLNALRHALTTPPPSLTTPPVRTGEAPLISVRSRALSGLPPAGGEPTKLLRAIHVGGHDYLLGVPAAFPFTSASVALGIIDLDAVSVTSLPDDSPVILDVTSDFRRGDPDEPSGTFDFVRARARLNGAVLSVRVDLSPEATRAPAESHEALAISQPADSADTDGTRCVGRAWTEAAETLQALVQVDDESRRTLCRRLVEAIPAVPCADDGPAARSALADLRAFGELLSTSVCAATPWSPPTAPTEADREDEALRDIVLALLSGPEQTRLHAPRVVNVLDGRRSNLRGPVSERLSWLRDIPYLSSTEREMDPLPLHAEASHWSCNAAESQCSVAQPGGVVRLQFRKVGTGSNTRWQLIEIHSETP